MRTTALLASAIPSYPKRSGKVRDLYDLPGDRLLIVATDRISAYDVVMANGIPDKGRVLTQISMFWFKFFAAEVPNHVLSAELSGLPPDAQSPDLAGRSLLCRKAEVVPIECVVRGYLAGSGWRQYKESGDICGATLPKGLKQCSELPEPIFTPSTKAQTGHDENISFEAACGVVGPDLAKTLRDYSLRLYTKARAYAAERGIIVADTKFEFGVLPDGNVILIDEVLTPDSSRFWPADAYKPGRDQPSFDKQFVRDYLDEIGFNHQPPGPILPPEIVERTREKYIEAYTRLTGLEFPW
jgi:phosphoribosylaminoimidazole-succinocarboxamide synthase